jgi:hypothetical protein
MRSARADPIRARSCALCLLPKKGDNDAEKVAIVIATLERPRYDL